MATWRTYGAGVLVTGIMITGTVWFSRDGANIHGEDAAECLAAVSERQTIARHTGEDSPDWPTNRVSPFIVWAQTYNDMLCAARDMAMSDDMGLDGLLFWAGTDDVPADGSELLLSTNAPMQLTGSSERFPYPTVSWMAGWSSTNLPVRQALWGLSTNGAPPISAYSSGTLGYTGKNWWTQKGLGTNAPKYACEYSRMETNSYVITAKETVEYSVGQVFSYSGSYSTNYFGSSVKVRDYGDLRFYYDLPDGSARWFLGRPGLDWISASPLWPDIGTLNKSGIGSITFAAQATNAIATSKWITTNNFNQARTVLQNLTRTVWIAPMTAFTYTTALERVTGAVAYMPATNDFEFYNEAVPGSYYYSMLDWSPTTPSNAVYSGLVTPWISYQHMTGYHIDNWFDNGWLYEREHVTHSFFGCRVGGYPSDYAFASNYVARYRVWLLARVDPMGVTSVPISEYADPPRWALLVDSSDPTATVYFDLQPEAYEWTDFPVGEESFTALYGMLTTLLNNGHTGWTSEYVETDDIEQRRVPLALIVAVDWKWKHLNTAAPYEPEPYTPAWLATP